jgi:transposase
MTTIELDNLPTAARQAFQTMQAEIQRLEFVIRIKDEQIRLLHLSKFGPKADKLSKDQLSFIVEEVVVTAPEVEREADLPQKEKVLPRAKAPRKNHPGRAELPAHLERREEIIPCCPEDCHCAKCGLERPVIGYEVREELDCEPAKYFVRVIKREKRGSHCLEEQGVAVAPAPMQILPKSKLSDAFIIEALAAKFQQHQPVYRQCAVLLEDHGIDLSRQTLNEGILRAAELLIPVTRAMKAELLAGDYIQADETTLPCQDRQTKGKNHQSYLWEYSSPGATVVFQFERGRGRAGPQEFLKGFRGILQTDGYGAYDHLGEGITYLACMAHLRRGFVDAAKVAPEDPLPPEIVRRFDQLYAIERRAKEQNLDTAGRLALRQSQSKPLMEGLQRRIVEVRQQVTPESKLAKACDYALGQWGRMEVYLEHGQVEIDNNWCEGAIRPVALGRKNWLHLGDESAGPKIAAIISIVETCRRLDIPLRTYLGEILPKLGDWPVNRVSELTPHAWKVAQSIQQN